MPARSLRNLQTTRRLLLCIYDTQAVRFVKHDDSDTNAMIYGIHLGRHVVVGILADQQ